MTPYFLRHTCASTLAVILAAFVAAVPAPAASKDPAPVALTGSLSDTRVFAPSDCVFAIPDSGRAATGALLAASAIKVGLNRLGAALRAAGSEKTFTTIRSTNIDFNPQRPPGCVYIVKGSFLADGEAARAVMNLPDVSPQCNLAWANALAPVAMRLRAAQNYCVARRLAENGIFLSGPPDFFYEGRVITSNDKSALALETSVVHVAKHLDSSLNKEGGTLVLSFAIGEPGSGAPGADKLSSTASVTQVSLGRIKAPATYFFTGGAGVVAPWLSLGKLDEKKPTSPRVLWAARSETRDAREFLLFLADVLDDSKQDLTTSLQQTLISSERDKAELAKLTADSAAQTAAEKKWAEAEVAKGEYDDLIAQSPRPRLSERQNKATQVRGLQREANILARTSGMSPYYANLLEIPTT